MLGAWCGSVPSAWPHHHTAASTSPYPRGVCRSQCSQKMSCHLKEKSKERSVSEEPTNPCFMGFAFLILVLRTSVLLGSSLCPQACCSTRVDLLEALGQKLTRGNATSPLESGNAKFWGYVAFALEQKSSPQLSLWGFVGAAGRTHLIAPKERLVLLLQFWLFHCCKGQLRGRPSLSRCHSGVTVSPTQGKD